MRVIDIHTHAFTDDVAAKAIPALEREAKIKPSFDGTVAGLLALMDETGVERTVIQPVATKPAQVRAINDWAAALAGERLAPFGAMHPDLPDAADEIARMAALGLRGFKLHPEFQRFRPDEPRMAPIYAAAIANHMTIFYHAGEDLAIPTVNSTPEIFARVIADHPDLTLVLAHMGGWRQWDDVERHLVGKDVHLETSFTIPYTGEARFVELVTAHGADKVVFGSDGPWAHVGREVERLQALDLAPDALEAILWRNAVRLLA